MRGCGRYWGPGCEFAVEAEDAFEEVGDVVIAGVVGAMADVAGVVAT
jgi:hypothetical protein